MKIESFALFHFEFNKMIFNYVQRNMIHSCVVNFEIHATCGEGEKFLADEDNYNDAFFKGRGIFILRRTQELEDARKQYFQSKQNCL